MFPWPWTAPFTPQRVTFRRCRQNCEFRARSSRISRTDPGGSPCPTLHVRYASLDSSLLACSIRRIPRRAMNPLQIIELGERLGFDSAWLRHRHLQFGISSPMAIDGRGQPAHLPDRAWNRRDPAGLGKPAAPGRGPGHRGSARRRTNQSGAERGRTDALRHGEARAVPGFRASWRTSATHAWTGLPV